MYTSEEKEKAVRLYIESGLRVAPVINALGFPAPSCLKRWYREYMAAGEKIPEPKRKYTHEQKKKILQHYQEHGYSKITTSRELGVPYSTLNDIIEAAKMNEETSCFVGTSVIRYTEEQKAEIVVKRLESNQPYYKAASELGISETTIRKWEKQLLEGGAGVIKQQPKSLEKKEYPKNDTDSSVRMDEVERLRRERDELLAEVQHLQMQKDILEKAGELIKKDQGINLMKLTNREKALVIDALREKYKLAVLLKELRLAKSSFCYQIAVIKAGDKHATIRNEIRAIFDSSKGRYGYRRIAVSLRRKDIICSEKVVRRIMKEENLKPRQPRVKKYSSYQGEITPAVKNLVQRNFHAETPNKLWLTDITEFAIPAGKIYLSPMLDCYDGQAVAWTIGRSPSAQLANKMLEESIATLRDDEFPIVHSDRGCHYRWPEWIRIMDERKLTRSMSRKGCSPDNSACEGFFGRLKNEMFYGNDWSTTTVDEFIAILDRYIHWYNEERIKISLGGMSPAEYRKAKGFAA